MNNPVHCLALYTSIIVSKMLPNIFNPFSGTRVPALPLAKTATVPEILHSVREVDLCNVPQNGHGEAVPFIFMRVPWASTSETALVLENHGQTSIVHLQHCTLTVCVKATQTRQKAILANLEADASKRQAVVYEKALRDYEAKNAGWL
ncbi:hypothetical protein PHLCEN_2v1136 [Hermanssonia centrifuga]|uniref:Uncharacterized protein n=1 Tax=Hermanssonia centrifuga TaxID=98765 RepID=A0A2R6S443_9APHY|nr:hypothetical protein PHLCEN_2v1136 [Hermanssonia centrifuga]